MRQIACSITPQGKVYEGPVTSMPWPDEDYPPGNPKRSWGTMSIEGDVAEARAMVHHAVNAGRITMGEEAYILGALALGDKFIPQHVIDLKRSAQ